MTDLNRPPRRAFVSCGVLFFGVLLLLAIWQIAIQTGWVSRAALASPSELPGGFERLFSDGHFLTDDLFATLKITLISVAIGYPLGVAAAASIAGAGAARLMATHTLDFVRSVPITALLPVFIILFGLGDPSKVAIGALSAGTVTAVAALEGILASFAKFAPALHLYRPSFIDRWYRIGLPYAAPSLLAALRLAVSAALVLVVVAEMFIGSQHGVGKVINDLSYTDDRPRQLAAVLVVGVAGFLLNMFIYLSSTWALRRAHLT
jgi:ABC-type nitrate/sulfonate/bicarbonate transport system permease component